LKSQFAERFLPFEFEAAGATRRCLNRQRDAALRALRFATCPLHCETPLDQRTVVISLDPLGGGERRRDAERRQRGNHGLRRRRIDLHGRQR
jgi:hypothetical protein